MRYLFIILISVFLFNCENFYVHRVSGLDIPDWKIYFRPSDLKIIDSIKNDDIPTAQIKKINFFVLNSITHDSDLTLRCSMPNITYSTCLGDCKDISLLIAAIFVQLTNDYSRLRLRGLDIKGSNIGHMAVYDTIDRKYYNLSGKEYVRRDGSYRVIRDYAFVEFLKIAYYIF